MKFFRLIGCALFLRKLHPIVLMISMTNSMLTTLNNSALKISKDKHVGYVLSMFCISLRRPVVKLRLTWPGYHVVTPFLPETEAARAELFRLVQVCTKCADVPVR